MTAIVKLVLDVLPATVVTVEIELDVVDSELYWKFYQDSYGSSPISSVAALPARMVAHQGRQ